MSRLFVDNVNHSQQFESYLNRAFNDNAKVEMFIMFTNFCRQGEGKYLPSDIDPTLCTHITYGFAVLDSSSLTIKPHDSWADIDNGNPFFNT